MSRATARSREPLSSASANVALRRAPRRLELRGSNRTLIVPTVSRLALMGLRAPSGSLQQRSGSACCYGTSMQSPIRLLPRERDQPLDVIESAARDRVHAQ